MVLRRTFFHKHLCINVILGKRCLPRTWSLAAASVLALLLQCTASVSRDAMYPGSAVLIWHQEWAPEVMANCGSITSFKVAFQVSAVHFSKEPDHEIDQNGYSNVCNAIVLHSEADLLSIRKHIDKPSRLVMLLTSTHISYDNDSFAKMVYSIIDREVGAIVVYGKDEINSKDRDFFMAIEKQFSGWQKYEFKYGTKDGKYINLGDWEDPTHIELRGLLAAFEPINKKVVIFVPQQFFYSTQRGADLIVDECNSIVVGDPQ